VIPLRGLDLAPLPAAEHRDAAGDLGSEGAASLFLPEEVLPERHRFRWTRLAFWSVRQEIAALVLCSTLISWWY